MIKPDMKKIILVTISILFIPVVLLANETVWLSPKGSDTSDGTKAAPYYSLNKAIKGRLESRSENDTLFVNVLAGNYYMDRPFEIEQPSRRPIVIRGYDAENKPRFIGGIAIKGWQKYDDKLCRIRIPEVVHYGLTIEQLFVNGKRAILARTPNVDWYTVKNAVETNFVSGVDRKSVV